MAAACFVLYYTNFFRECWEDPRVDWAFFGIGLTGVGMNMSILFYMAFYLPYIAGVEEDYETYCPKLIKIMAVSAILSFFL
jgi:hypothetical protein